ncbi:MAG: hypothetical protein IPJ19_05475 [Planctomycetes bacterium]|nr:hypothetical protein [Planctomycetota bacterium]
MDSSVQRILPEPVVTGSHGSARTQQRRRREHDEPDAEHAPFPVEPAPALEQHAHFEPRSPDVDGLGGKLDVTA